MFTTAADEADNLLAAGKAQALSEEGILAFLELRFGAREGEAIRRDLMRILERLQNARQESRADGGARYRLAIAFFPLDG